MNHNKLLFFFVICSLDRFLGSVKNYAGEWKKVYDLLNPQDAEFPQPYAELHGLLRLIIIRCIRPDKVVPAVQVKIVIGVMSENLI